MSGDVFGNGMLLSDRIRLVARLRPPPRLHRPRSRTRPRRSPSASGCSSCAGSSWNDYDRAKISEGGGVWPRTAKWIPLSEAARAALGIEDERSRPTTSSARSCARRSTCCATAASARSSRPRRDRRRRPRPLVSDAIRVDASDLRCRVVGEGGNLGLTHRARIEFARGGGRINADFIDNSAGVDCSDHEVNLKILLGPRRARAASSPARSATCCCADGHRRRRRPRAPRLVPAGADPRAGGRALAPAARTPTRT